MAISVVGWPILKTNQTGFQATGEGRPSTGHLIRGCRWWNSLKKCGKPLIEVICRDSLGE